MKSKPQLLFLLATLVLGAYVVVHYSAYLHRQELRDWKNMRVHFVDVGGLKAKTAVMVNGAAMGRVRSVRMHLNRQLVELDLEPQLELHGDFVVEIVSTSALGFVGVEITPGAWIKNEVGDFVLDAAGEKQWVEPIVEIDPERIYKGTVRDDFGGAPPTPGRRKELQRSFDEWATWAESLKDPDAGIVGRLFFDRQRRIEFQEALDGFEQTWIDIDEGLANLENGSTGLTSEDALIAARVSVQALNETFASFRSTLRDTQEDEDGKGAFFASPNFGADWRRAFIDTSNSVADAAAGRGALGRLRHGESYNAIADVTSELDEETAAAVRGEGFLGLLSSQEAGDESRDILRGLSEGLERFDQSPMVNKPEIKRDVEDLIGDVDDALGNLRRGLEGLRRGLPDKTLHGAVLSVF